MTRAQIALALMMLLTASTGGSAAQVAVTEADAAHVGRAQAVVESFFPQESREQMLAGMNAAISANMRTGMLQSEPLKELMRAKPATRDIIDKFLAEEERHSGEQLAANFPKLLNAMAIAYARRFTLNQLDDLSRFFSTPTGQHYIKQSTAILADPDVARVQSDMMAESMNRLPGKMPELIRRLRSVAAPTSKAGNERP